MRAVNMNVGPNLNWDLEFRIILSINQSTNNFILYEKKWEKLYLTVLFNLKF